MRAVNWLYLIPLLLCTFNVSAQSDAVIRPYVFASPLKLADPSNPGILYGGGLEFPSGIAVELGHLILLPSKVELENLEVNRGNRFHLAVRKYFDIAGVDIRPYVQFRGDLQRRYHDESSSFYSADTVMYPDGGYYRDTFEVSARSITLNLITGLEFKLTKHFFFDGNLGLGVRYKNTRHLDRANPRDVYQLRGEDWFNRSQPGKVRTFNVPLDLRFLYRF